MFKVSVLDIKTASTIFQKLVSLVVLPGEEGELSILDFHQPIISCLKDGMIKIDNIPPMVIKGGIASMQDNELIVLVEKK
jgi:F0F1-type ATP synthase epsilon subunit